MDTTKISSVVQALRNEEVHLQETQQRTEAALKSLKGDLKRVRNAIRALGAKASGKTATQQKPAVTKREVVGLISDLLRGRQQPVADADLKKMVENAAVQAGKSKLGLSLRFQEALREPCFKESPEGYQIDQQSSAEREHA